MVRVEGDYMNVKKLMCGEMVSSSLIRLHVVATSFVRHNAGTFLFILGVALLAGGLAGVSHALPDSSALDNDDRLSTVASALLRGFIEGPFGALLMIIAGLVAIIAAAMGAYRAAMACLVIAVGAFVLRSFVNLFFGDVITLDE